MALKTESDLFESSTMTFGEHLEELRKCLMKAVIGLVIGTIIGFFLGDRVVKLIERPLRGALERYYVTQAETQYLAWAKVQLKAGRPIPYTLEEIKAIARGNPEKGEPELIYEIQFIHPSLMNATLHAVDPKSGDARSPVGGLSSANPTTSPTGSPTASPTASSAESPAAMGPEGGSIDRPAPAAPVDDAELDTVVKGNPDPNSPKRYTRDNLAAHLLWHPIETDGRFNMQATGVAEPFSVWLKASLVVGVVLSSPWVFYHIWTFVAAGLYSHERKYVYTYMPFSIGLFLAGAALAYLAVFPPVLDFLFDFNKELGIDPDPKIGE